MSGRMVTNYFFPLEQSPISFSLEIKMSAVYDCATLLGMTPTSNC